MKTISSALQSGYVSLLLSAAFGYILANFFGGKYEGDKIERSLRFSIGAYYLHLHHWMYYSVLLGLLWYAEFYHPLIYGFLFGVIVQGLTYGDRFYIFYKKKNFAKLYRKWAKKR